jgi:homeobox-leucine zipper protein
MRVSLVSSFLQIMAHKGGGAGAGGAVGGGGGRQAASDLINLNVKETEASCSNRSENSSEISRPAPAADESTINSHRPAAALPFYGRSGGGGLDQLLQHGHALSAAKMELGHGGGADAASFGSFLCGGGAVVDEQPPFWPWAADGHHNFQ